jgi:hypothetical protein
VFLKIQPFKMRKRLELEFPISIPNTSGIHGVCTPAPNFDFFDFSLHTKLLSLGSNLLTSSNNTKRSQALKVKRDQDTVFVLLKFGLRRVLLSVEGAASDPAKVSSRGP